MIPTNSKLVTGALLVMLLGVFSITTFAQHDHGNMGGSKSAAKKQDMQPGMMKLGKKGEIPFNSPVRVGDVLLKPGTYQIQHVMDGENHVITFRRISRDPYRGESLAGNEAARVTCRTEPLGEKARHDGIRLGTNAAGEKTVEEVHVKGENVGHVF